MYAVKKNMAVEVFILMTFIFLNGVMCESPIWSSTKVGQELWKLWVAIHLHPQVKYGFQLHGFPSSS
jgi:hypothetical protein